MPKKVFISWSGDLGRQLAKTLSETILDDSELSPWISSKDIQAGEAWFREIEEAAEKCDVAIGIMTPDASKRPWVNFEAGILYGRLGNFKMLRFNEQPSGPLANLQSIDGMSKEALKDMLEKLLSKPGCNMRVR